MNDTQQKKAPRSGQSRLAKRGVARPKKGGILAALRRSPLVGADLNLFRSRESGRKAGR